jgi:hypothetical protein
MRGVTTMNKDQSKRLYYYSTFDGGLYVQGTNARFIMNMRKDNLDYVERVRNTLEEVGIGTRLSDRKDYNTDGYTRQPQVRLESKTHPVLTKIWERIYLNGNKVIDPHMLTLLDEEALAIIFMADGGRSDDKRCNATPKYSLHTKGFSYGDNYLLKKAIKDKLDLEFNINRHYKYWLLCLRAKDSYKFEELVKPYVLPSFGYKLERKSP